MILVTAVVLSLAVGLLRHGRLEGVIQLPLRWGFLALIAFAVQAYFIYRTPPGYVLDPAITSAGDGRVPWGWQELLFLCSHVLILVVLVANRQLAGVRWIACGLLLNLLVMSANGGWMPVTPDALISTGQANLVSSMASGIRVQSSKSIVLAQHETRLWVLSDVFVLAQPFPLPSVFSIGDVLVALGVSLLLQNAMLIPTPQTG